MVDDHSTFSELLARVLDAEPGFTCIGTATTDESARLLLESLAPDVVVMDVQLGTSDGIELTAEFTRARPDLRVAILTARTDAALVHRAALAGACCILPKDGSLAELMTALREARVGGLTVHSHLLQSLVTDTETRAPGRRLTERERDVLVLMSEGHSVRQVARALSISEHTARGYVKKLLLKTDSHSQLEAVAKAHRYGLLP